jgi:hypothetical protein
VIRLLPDGTQDPLHRLAANRGLARRGGYRVPP